MHCVANGSEEQKERKKKKRKREKKKNEMNDDEKLLGSFSFIKLRYFEDYSILNYSNHVQSDNKEFSHALGSTIAICTCPPSKVCVPFSPSPQRNYFPMVFFDESR